MSSVLVIGLLCLTGLEVGLLITAVVSSVLVTGLRLKLGTTVTVASSVFEIGCLLTGCFLIDGVGFGLGLRIIEDEPSSVFELLGESSVLEVDPEPELELELELVEGFDLLLVLFFFPFVIPFVISFVIEPLRFVGCFATGPGLQFPVSPPIFVFNQSRPLFTAFLAICLVALLTLFASESKIFEQGLLKVGLFFCDDFAFVFFAFREGLLFVFIFVGLFLEIEDFCLVLVLVLSVRLFEIEEGFVFFVEICFLLILIFAGLFFPLFTSAFPCEPAFCLSLDFIFL